MIRSSFGLPLLNSFADLSADPNVRAGLRDMYYGINRADPWIAMLCEDHVAGASVGATTFAVLKDQFQRLRDGDRFWYQREFSGRALEVIEETRLSNVIRRNTKITRLRNDVFTLPR